MMLGEPSYGRATTTVHVPPWSFAADDPASICLSPNGGGSVDDYSAFLQTDSLKLLQRFLPSNSNDAVTELPVDAHTCDHFRMFEFKVRRCGRGRSHDWTECPYAHPGEKARRRDPRRFHYSGAACPDFRRGGGCRRGDACEFSHGVFECWLHPARYRTQPCKDGAACRRRVCFFAHSPDQLRVLSPRADSPRDRLALVSSPDPASPTTESPPMLPGNEILASLRQLHLSKVSSLPSPSSWIGGDSPRLKVAPPGWFSLPTTPTGAVARPGITYFDAWERSNQEAAAMDGEDPSTVEWVESGRDLRAKMFEKLSKENPLDRSDSDPNPNPDVGWVSELIK